VHRFFQRADEVFVLWRDDRGLWVSRERPDGTHIETLSLRNFISTGDDVVVGALMGYLEAALDAYEAINVDPT
jgi:hypothetical protein